MFRFALTASIWLSAALVPFQGFAGHECCCAGDVSCQGKNTCGETFQNSSGSCCCCKHDTQPVRSPRPCCSQKSEATEHNQCRCGSSCRCRHSEQSPAEEKAPSQHHRVTTDQIAGSSECFTVDSPRNSLQGVPSSSLAASAALDRCVLLCRFHL